MITYSFRACPYRLAIRVIAYVKASSVPANSTALLLLERVNKRLHPIWVETIVFHQVVNHEFYCEAFLYVHNRKVKPLCERVVVISVILKIQFILWNDCFHLRRRLLDVLSWYIELLLISKRKFLIFRLWTQGIWSVGRSWRLNCVSWRLRISYHLS